MNEVFLIGKIISNIEFGFMIQSNYFAMSRFKIELLDDQILEIRAYDKNADFVYSKINRGENVFIYGAFKGDFVLARSIGKL